MKRLHYLVLTEHGRSYVYDLLLIVAKEEDVINYIYPRYDSCVVNFCFTTRHHQAVQEALEAGAVMPLRVPGEWLAAQETSRRSWEVQEQIDGGTYQFPVE